MIISRNPVNEIILTIAKTYAMKKKHNLPKVHKGQLEPYN